MPVRTRPCSRPLSRARLLLLLLGVAVLTGAALLPDSAAAAPPFRIVIPALGVDADIVTLGLDADGTMQSPNRGDLVAWYDFAAGAGEPGNAVLAAHRDYAGRRGAFFALDALQPGDEIWLQDASAVWYLYRVEWTAAYPEDSAPVDLLTTPTSSQSLTLITCSGSFDRSTGRYRDRQVVRATLAAIVLPDPTPTG